MSASRRRVACPRCDIGARAAAAGGGTVALTRSAVVCRSACISCLRRRRCGCGCSRPLARRLRSQYATRSRRTRLRGSAPAQRSTTLPPRWPRPRKPCCTGASVHLCAPLPVCVVVVVVLGGGGGPVGHGIYVSAGALLRPRVFHPPYRTACRSWGGRGEVRSHASRRNRPASSGAPVLSFTKAIAQPGVAPRPTRPAMWT
jgi:hypothetical protein